KIVYQFQRLISNFTTSGLEELKILCSNLQDSVENLYNVAKTGGGSEYETWRNPEKLKLRIFSELGEESVRNSSLYEGLMSYIISCNTLLTIKLDDLKSPT